MPELPPDADTRFVSVLGQAVTHVWAELPQDVQRQIFEHAVITGHKGECDESLREQLAQFLHDRHKRTRQDS
jgi:hypothetical protein